MGRELIWILNSSTSAWCSGNIADNALKPSIKQKSVASAMEMQWGKCFIRPKARKPGFCSQPSGLRHCHLTFFYLEILTYVIEMIIPTWQPSQDF
jgi:hypothetical protein